MAELLREIEDRYEVLLTCGYGGYLPAVALGNIGSLSSPSKPIRVSPSKLRGLNLQHGSP
jgi:hypothetical protein